MAEEPGKTQGNMKKRTKRKPELRIVLDTNQLYTGSASDLLREEVVQLILDCRRHQDVSLVWYIPEVVRLERRHQMQQAGRELLPSVNKLERLLGHGLGISEDILTDRVGAAIGKQVATLSLQILPIDTGRVDWRRLIDDSAGRRPPFEPGKNEKGFRDALVAESFLQLVEDSPRTAAICRVVLVTADGLLASAVEARTTDAVNVRILKSLDELRDLVNTVVADVTEDFVKAIRDAAGPYFFEKNNQDSLYLSAKVRDQIVSRFGSELSSKPSGAEARKNGTWFINPPRFSKKKGQRVHWVSTVRVEAKAVRNEAYPDYGPASIGSTVVSSLSPGTFVPLGIQPQIFSRAPSSLWLAEPSSNIAHGTFAGHGSPNPPVLEGPPPLFRMREVIVAEGQSVFEVLWSVTVTANRKLVSPRVDEICHVETTWNGGPAV